MTEWWYGGVIVALALVGILVLRRLGDRNGRSQGDRRERAGADRDFEIEREDARQAHMSVEDRAWEAASLERNRERRQRTDSPAEHRNVAT